MTQIKIITATAAALFALICMAVSTPTYAQSPCGIGQVSPINQFFNVRGNAGNTTQTPIATVQRGTSVPVTGSTVAGGSVWWRLCQGGWVAESVSNLTPYTNTPTPSRTATRPAVTPTASPTRIVASATLLPGQMTVTPEATANPSAMWQYGADGKLSINVFCPEACEFVIEVENLK